MAAVMQNYDPRQLGQEKEGVTIVATTREKEQKREQYRAEMLKRYEAKQAEKKKGK